MRPRASLMNEFSYILDVKDIGDAGRSFAFSANPDERAALVHRLGLEKLRSLSVSGHIRPLSDGRTMLVQGSFSAEVVQSCVVTLDPVESRLEETFEIRYVSNGDLAAATEHDVEVSPEDTDEEPFDGTSIDLGAVAVEFLSLALDPYPRKPRAEFAFETAPEQDLGPFAGLAKLRNKV